MIIEKIIQVVPDRLEALVVFGLYQTREYRVVSGLHRRQTESAAPKGRLWKLIDSPVVSLRIGTLSLLLWCVTFSTRQIKSSAQGGPVERFRFLDLVFATADRGVFPAAEKQEAVGTMRIHVYVVCADEVKIAQYRSPGGSVICGQSHCCRRQTVHTFICMIPH